MICYNQNINKQFSFQQILQSVINKEILNLDSCELYQNSDVTTKFMEMNSNVFTVVS